MSITPQDMYLLAYQLADEAGEAQWRTSAAKAYYAAFFKSQEYMHHCPDNAQFHMGSHERVSDRFELKATNKSKAVAYSLITMKKVRHIADYEIEDDFVQHEAKMQCAKYPVLEKYLNEFDAECSSKTASGRP